MGDRETKAIPFIVKALDEEGRTFEGLAAAFGNLDRVDDIIHKGAFTKTLVERGDRVRFLWQHDPREPLGKIKAMRETPEGLEIAGVVSETRRGKDVLALLKDGAIEGLSIGYEPLVYDYSHEGEKDVRHLREVRLHEVSVVTFPANEEARVTAVKEDEPEEDKAEGEPTKRAAGQDLPASSFLVVEDEDTPSTWHLPVRDADGNPEPRLCGAAWAALHEGSRGNVYEGPDKEGAIRELTRIYREELEREPPGQEEEEGDKQQPMSLVLDEDTIRVVVADPDTLDADGFRTVELAQGINAVVGRKDNASMVQCFVFDREAYTPEQAGDWVKSRGADPKALAEIMMAQLWGKGTPAPLSEVYVQTKAGRVLSQINRSLIGRVTREVREALAALEELYEATAPLSSDTESEEEAAEDAGPGKNAPPTYPESDRKELLAAIENGMLSLGELEVPNG